MAGRLNRDAPCCFNSVHVDSPVLMQARLGQCPLRSESDRSAAFPRIDGRARTGCTDHSNEVIRSPALASYNDRCDELKVIDRERPREAAENARALREQIAELSSTVAELKAAITKARPRLLLPGDDETI
jgi:hypothetical protein